MELWFDNITILVKAASLLEDEGIENRLECNRIVITNNYTEACRRLDHYNFSYVVA